MVEDGRDALFDAVDVERVGAGAGAFERQVAVNGPPCAVEHFKKLVGLFPTMERPRASAE